MCRRETTESTCSVPSSQPATIWLPSGDQATDWIVNCVVKETDKGSRSPAVPEPASHHCRDCSPRQQETSSEESGDQAKEATLSACWQMTASCSIVSCRKMRSVPSWLHDARRVPSGA